MARNAQTAAILAAGEIRAKTDRHPEKKDTRSAVYRQSIGITVDVLVDGTMDDFDNILTDSLREKIEQYVTERLGAEVKLGLVDLWANRGPSGSRFYHPEEVSERAVLNRSGLHVQVRSLKVPRIDED